jgi:predicted aminopeptidase
MIRPVTVLFAAVLAAASCSPLYVLRAGYEEARILSARRPIEDVAADPAADSVTRRKLELVIQARDFADRALGLAANESYTTFSAVGRDTLLLVVSAAHKDRFEPHTWWFPIVGHVPYKGFFDFDDAFAQADRLAARGYDTYVRPSGAFSTLGWFNDPLLNTLLRYGDIALASTVIHEITHNTLYLKSQAGFNESFASFVGDRGAILFFCEREGPDADRCRQAADAWHDTRAYGRFITGFIDDLRALYGRADLTSDQKIAQREAVFDAARTRFVTDVAPQLRTRGYRDFPERELNNATLIGVHLYYERLDLFEAVYLHFGEDLVAATRAIENAARAHPDDPFRAVESLLPAAQPDPPRTPSSSSPSP